MKKFFVLFLGLIVVLSVNLSAFAAETTTTGTTMNGDTYYNTYVTEDGDTINVEIEQNQLPDQGEGELYSIDSYVDYSSVSGYSVTAADANGLKAVLLSFIGDYEGIVVEYSYQNTNGYTSYVREIQLDYPWLCACGLLVIVIYCLFRLGGSILCRK